MTNDPDRLERLARQSQPSIVAEFFAFLRENKKWWLLPILLLIAVLGLLIALASTGAAPFIYTMF
ncbi:DUF5989 family protein [Tundrisphaera lichenicola]|uniref:DUF5989 family protein n=1 Tax=Tundrisphaera lichenicola TaxID=2029860 RepID=UPI003EB92158